MHVKTSLLQLICCSAIFAHAREIQLTPKVSIECTSEAIAGSNKTVTACLGIEYVHGAAFTNPEMTKLYPEGSSRKRKLTATLPGPRFPEAPFFASEHPEAADFLGGITYSPSGKNVEVSRRFLDVFLPNRNGQLRGEQKYGILIYIHGGGLGSGSRNHSMNYPPNLFRFPQFKNMMVVAPSYSLGPYGFWHMEDENGVVHSNVGIRDLIEALRWVQTYAEQFGGDLDNVTIVGQSAGASLIEHLMHILKDLGKFGFSRAPFQRAALMSGTRSLFKPRSIEKAYVKQNALLHHTGCSNYTSPDAAMQCLQNLDPQELTNIAAKHFGIITPVIDGFLFPESSETSPDDGSSPYMPGLQSVYVSATKREVATMCAPYMSQLESRSHEILKHLGFEEVLEEYSKIQQTRRSKKSPPPQKRSAFFKAFNNVVTAVTSSPEVVRKQTMQKIFKSKPGYHLFVSVASKAVFLAPVQLLIKSLQAHGVAATLQYFNFAPDNLYGLFAGAATILYPAIQMARDVGVGHCYDIGALFRTRISASTPTDFSIMMSDDQVLQVFQPLLDFIAFGTLNSQPLEYPDYSACLKGIDPHGLAEHFYSGADFFSKIFGNSPTPRTSFPSYPQIFVSDRFKNLFNDSPRDVSPDSARSTEGTSSGDSSENELEQLLDGTALNQKRRFGNVNLPQPKKPRTDSHE